MNITYDFSDKVVLVTGASRGIGLAIARAFASAGATLAITAHSQKIHTIAKELSAFSICADLAIPAERKRCIDAVIEKFGRLDVLVNNAGIQIRHQPEEFPLDDFEAVLNLNLVAMFDLCRMAGATMLSQGAGSIINMASMLSYFGGTTVPAYAASKGGVAQLTKALSNDWAGRGIRVNAIAPGYIDTDMNEALLANPVRFQEITSRIPMGRFGAPEEIAPAVLFLASDAAAYLSGAILPVDGGYLGR